jgi:hypothetical protein
MRRCFAITLSLLGLAALPGCTTQQGYLPLVMTRPVDIDLGNADFNQIQVVREVEGSNTRVTSVLFFPTQDAPNLRAAVEDAMAKEDGDLMTRVNVSSTDWWFLVGVSTLHVKGNVARLENLR